MFYTYRQNNSGGEFTVNSDVTVTVIVEADNADRADSRAEKLGIYFNGVNDDIDCECCGDRWSPAYDRDGTETPMVYGQPVESYKTLTRFIRPDEPSIYVYYLDGSKKSYYE